MEYVESAAFFCATTDTAKDHIIDSLSTRHNAPLHHLRDLADTNLPKKSVQDPDAKRETKNNWEALSPHARATALSHVEVYLDDFISIVQKGPTERRQMT